MSTIDPYVDVSANFVFGPVGLPQHGVGLHVRAPVVGMFQPFVTALRKFELAVTRGWAAEFTVLLRWQADARAIEGSIQQNVQLDRPSSGKNGSGEPR